MAGRNPLTAVLTLARRRVVKDALRLGWDTRRVARFSPVGRRVAVPAVPVVLTTGVMLRAVCLVGGCRRVIAVAASRAELEAEAELHRRAAHDWVKPGRLHRVEEVPGGES